MAEQKYNQPANSGYANQIETVRLSSSSNPFSFIHDKNVLCHKVKVGCCFDVTIDDAFAVKALNNVAIVNLACNFI